MGEYDGCHCAVLGVAHGGPTLTTVWNLSSGCPLKLYVWTHLELQQEIKKLTFHSSVCHLLLVAILHDS